VNDNPAQQLSSGVSFEPASLEEMTPQEALEAVLLQAAAMSASDLYILAEGEATRIAVRWLGTVKTLTRVSKAHGGAFVRSLKANAGMDITETRRPLDGRYIQRVGDRRIDLRINCVPTLFGEDLTCRLLDCTGQMLEIDQLGMAHYDRSSLMAMLNSPSGLILVSGPTGSGKTTTLYACLRHLNDGSRKINTLEDPIEYALDGVCQSQINPKLGVTFSKLLPHILRQSPDVIMIGEIRDQETARTAVRAANSGDLVIATLHAPVAAGAVQAMLALHVHPYFLATCLLGIVAQRLIRVLNPATRIAYDISESPETFAEIRSLLGPDEGKTIYGPDPTDADSQNGYNARTGVFEVMPMSGAMRKLIAESKPAREVQQVAIEHGMIEFHRSALLKVAQGVTSTEEMLRAVPTEYLGLED
jgi:type II secretory ATPase GspE/PulE/Tfp pilus assembly ATPase PilB-like protein